MSGHDHGLQDIKVDGIDFFVSGGGGRANKNRQAPVASKCSSSVTNEEGFKFGSRTYGFLEVEADEEALRFKLIDQRGNTLWEAGG